MNKIIERRCALSQQYKLQRNTMKIHSNIPDVITNNWTCSIERHVGKEMVAFHYHDVEEWLQVVRGQISFFSAGEKEYRLSVAQVLQIPRGEVHRVEISPNGVEYRMWVPTAASREHFANELNEEDIRLIKDNLDLPKAEDNGNVLFFNGFISEQLLFRTAMGAELDKAGFIGRGFRNRNRHSDSIRVLCKGLDCVLISAVVTIEEGGAPQSFINERLFVREGSALKCRVWLNSPEPASS